jgi:L-lactate permease
LGYATLYKKINALFYLVLVVPLIQVLVMSGYVWDWPAGWVLGPRYLAPMLPMIALPAAIATRRYPFAGAYLAWLSVILTGLATLVDATPPAEPDVSNPLLEMYLPAVSEGKFG